MFSKNCSTMIGLMIMNSISILEKLDNLYPNAECELNYQKDYELLIAVVLSAQCTDKRVNMVTRELFKKYNLQQLANASITDIENIIYPVGTFHRKAMYIIEIAKRLIQDFNGQVPNDAKYLESLPGVGHKTANVVLSNIYNVPAIAVDTHVSRVSKRLKLANKCDDVKIIDKKLMQKFPRNSWSKLHHQLVLFGRYICKSQKPECPNCPFQEICKYQKKNS